MEREALYERIDARVDAMVAAGAGEEVRRANAAGASETARKALGFDELLAGDVEAMKRRTRNYARRQLTWMRKLAGAHVLDVTESRGRRRRGRDPRTGRLRRRVKFEKWQALGNDYLIIEEAALPFALTENRIRAPVRRPHRASGPTASCCSRPRTSAASSPACGSTTPTAPRPSSRATARARRSCTCASAAGPTRDTFSIQTAAGEIRPTITGETTCRVDMGRVALTSKDFPSGPGDGAATLSAGGREWRFQHVSVGNPQCAIHVGDRDELEALDLPAIGPAIEHHEMFPNRTNVSWFTEMEPGVVRARIFERGVGETMSSGTGATGAAVASVLRGGTSPVLVRLDGGELEVEVGEDLHVDLTGWAVPVYRGELAAEMIEELHETD